MNRYSIVIAILTGVLIALSSNIAITLHNAAEINKDVAHTCQATQVTADVAAEAFAEQKATSSQILPRLNFPGLSHGELVKLTVTKEIKEAARIKKLETIANKACKGV